MANQPTNVPGTGVVEKVRPEVKKPQLFKVLLHNDNYTTQDFVVQLLETIFCKAPAEAYGIMMQVHTKGSGVAGVYSFEVAETKVTLVHEEAREHGFPLRASLEEA
jgi:ATP-dependent Clp protease adaptor protein ClpS